ncbi:MAG: transcription termination factor NusA [Candidatus Nomurabacteria bacterium]|jgi:N utilization substance protein A|nr:transcription termination factor NusA [Candidatus Nomurabacteria bacterium]
MEGINLKELAKIVSVLAEEKNLPEEVVMGAVEQSIAAAWRRDNGDRDQNVRAVLNQNTGEAKVYVAYEVVEEVENSADQMTAEQAQEIKKGAKVGDVVEEEFEVKTLGRVAAQTAKQVVFQKLREAEREAVAAQFEDEIGEVITGTVQRIDPRVARIEIGSANASAIMPRDEQIPGERLVPGNRIKVLLKEIERGERGPQLILSRATPEFVKYLFEQEVPEIENGAVAIKGIARLAGLRTKIAVVSNIQGVDPVGTFVGGHGTRVQAVMNEIGDQEKIDIVQYDDDIKNYITNALSPAEITSIELDEAEKKAIIKLPEDQQKIAIGRAGQNVRLASILTGYNIDIETADGAKVASAEKPKKSGNIEDELLDVIEQTE